MITQDKLEKVWQAAYCCAGKLREAIAKKVKYNIPWQHDLSVSRLLYRYLHILENYKIPGESSVCCCSLEGAYTALLNGETEIGIEFKCDGTGYLIINEELYTLTWDSFSASSIGVTSNYEQITSTTEGGLSEGWFQAQTTVYITDGITFSVIYDAPSGFATIEEFITDFNLNNTAGVTASYEDPTFFFSMLGEEYLGQRLQLLVSDSIMIDEDWKEGTQVLTFTMDYETTATCGLDVTINNPEFQLTEVTNIEPCESTENPEGCLANADIEAIIRDINRICSIYNCC